MNEWALLKGGRIVNVVTTTKCKRHMMECHPGHEVQSLYGLPPDVLEAYEFYRERP
jgi:hypothetical protein